MVFWEFDVPKHVGVRVTPRLIHTYACMQLICVINGVCKQKHRCYRCLFAFFHPSRPHKIPLLNLVGSRVIGKKGG